MSGDIRTIDLPVIGMHCVNCAKSVERTLINTVPGVAEATVNFAAETVHVAYDANSATIDDLAEAVSLAGYTLVKPRGKRIRR